MAEYGASNIKVLKGLEAVRKRPGMYIGKLGDGSASDDGIYILLKEVIDNSIDEFIMGHGKKIVVYVTSESLLRSDGTPDTVTMSSVFSYWHFR